MNQKYFLARKKIKIGDTVNFNFAGHPYVGTLIEIKKSSWGTVTNTWYQVKHEDGTIYPCRKEAITLVNG